MANNSRVSRSASLEDLREKNVQIEADLCKLAEEVREVMKRQDESSKRQEDSQRRMEEASRAMDDKLGNLSLMLEKTMKHISGKSPISMEVETSNGKTNKMGYGDNHSFNQGRRVDLDGEEDGLNPPLHMNDEEYEWAEGYRRNRERVNRQEFRRGNTNVHLPRMEFPQFDGNDPKRWKMNCDFYFELYEVPEVYKTRMAIMNFSEDMHEWYRCLTAGGPQLPWELLVEEIMARFQSQNIKHLVDEFKRIHQLGRVEEFIKKFDRVRARLLLEKPNLDEEFFVVGFISGLKEEIRHTVELFNPRSLNNAFQCALRVETSYEVQNKRPKEMSRHFKFQKFPSPKQKIENERGVIKEIPEQKPWQNKPVQQTFNYEQRKELGLCHKCHGKYFPGHQCTGRVMEIISDSVSEVERSDSEDENDFDERLT